MTDDVKKSMTVEQYMFYKRDIESRRKRANCKIVKILREALASGEKPARVPRDVFDWMREVGVAGKLDERWMGAAGWTVEVHEGMMTVVNSDTYLHNLRPEMVIAGSDLADFLRAEAWGKVYLHQAGFDLPELSARLFEILREFPLDVNG